MKARGLLFASLLAITLLTGCGEEPLKKCNITFHQDQGDQDDVFEYTVNKTTYEEVKAFQDEIELNPRRGYDVSWEEYDLSTITEDYTVNAVYTLHTYTITYMFQTRVIGTATYTIESTMDDIVEPDLPNTAGYNYHYLPYTIEGKAEDFIVRAEREAITYYATFVDENGNEIGKVPFTVETESIEDQQPAVPEIAGKDGRWEIYDLNAEDIVVHPIYELHEYHAKFWSSSNEDKYVIKEIPFTIETTSIKSLEPEVPYDAEYHDGTWSDYTLAMQDLDIYPVYGDEYHVFTATFKASEEDPSPLVVNFTYETRTQELAGSKFGYDVYWLYDEEEYKAGESFTFPMKDITLVKSREVGHQHKITLDPNGGELTGGNEVMVTFGEEYKLETPTISDANYCFHSWNSNKPFPASGVWEIDEDVSLIALYALTFEGESVPSFITPKQQIKSLEISDEAATTGSKSLKITVTGSDYGVYFSKDWLESMFANPNVVAINFDAKGSLYSSNFRAKIGGSNITYERNRAEDRYGLDTIWKTFTFRREYYNSYVSGDAMIYGGGYPNGNYLYVDRVVAVTKELDSFGFENGSLNVGATEQSESIYMSAGHSNNQPTSEQIFKIRPDAQTSVSVSNVGFDYKDKTEENRSLTFEKGNGFAGFYLSSAIRTRLINLASEDNKDVEIIFDFKSTVPINSNPNVSNAKDGTNHPLGGDGYYIRANEWTTLSVSVKEGTTNDCRFLILQGSTAGVYHIDNIRFVVVDK